MSKEPILLGVVGLVVGLVFGYLAFSSEKEIKTEVTNQQSSSQIIEHKMDNNLVMQGMTQTLIGKTEDDFDKAFITEMIIHHEGAIDMANLAKQNAKHEELKQMADEIISAQSKEIETMKLWQKEWGY